MVKPTLNMKKSIDHPMQTAVMMSVVSLKSFPTASNKAPPAIGARIMPMEKKVP
jgi:hypothetical protein